MPARRRRPGSVTAAAVLSIIYGSFNVVGSLCGLILLAVGAGGGAGFGAPPQVVEFQKEMDTLVQKELPAKQAVDIGASAIGIPEGLLMLIGGIGLLSLKPWSRKLVIVVSLLVMALSIAMGVYSVGFLAPATKKAFQAAAENNRIVPQPAEVKKNGAAAMPVEPVKQDAARMHRVDLQAFEMTMNITFVVTPILLVLGLVYLTVIVVLLVPQRVRKAFASQAADDSDDRYDDEDDDERSSRRRDDDWDDDRPTRRRDEDDDRDRGRGYDDDRRGPDERFR